MIKLLWFLVLLPIIYFSIPIIIKGGIKRNIFIVIYVSILSFLTITYFNKISLFIPDEIGSIQQISSWKDKVNNQINNLFYDRNYIKNNFIMINTAFDQQLILNPEGDQNDSTTITITNRRQLCNLLKFLNNESSNIDLIVSDVIFSHNTKDDTALAAIFKRLEKKDKIIIGYNPRVPLNKVLTLSKENCADVSANVRESVVFDFDLCRTNAPSLPYLIYAKINKLKSYKTILNNSIIKETSTSGKVRYAFNNVIPQIYFHDEKQLNNFDYVDNGEKSVEALSVQSPTAPLQFDLSLASAKSSESVLHALLSDRKRRNLHNIVLIGTFGASDTDNHLTAYGQLHGTTIVMNIYYELVRGRHFLNIKYIMVIFFFFYFIVHRIIKQVLRPSKIDLDSDSKSPDILIKILKKFSRQKNPILLKYIKLLSDSINGIKKFVLFTINFIVLEESHFLLLFIMILVLDLLFGRIVNVIGLVIHFAAFSSILKFFVKQNKLIDAL